MQKTLRNKNKLPDSKPYFVDHVLLFCVQTFIIKRPYKLNTFDVKTKLNQLCICETEIKTL
jgi:hypothetical protein